MTDEGWCGQTDAGLTWDEGGSWRKSLDCLVNSRAAVSPYQPRVF